MPQNDQISQEIPFYSAIDLFLAYKGRELTIQRGADSSLTLRDYRYHLERFCRWVAFKQLKPRGKFSTDLPQKVQAAVDDLYFDIRLEDVDEDNIQNYLVEHTRAGNSVHTISAWLYTLKSFYKTISAKSKDKVPDIAQGIKRQAFTYEKGPHLELKQALQYLEYVAKMPVDDPLGFRNKVFLHTLLKFGLRLSETLGLTEEDLTFQEEQLLVHVHGKRRRNRTLPLPLFEAGTDDSKGLTPILGNVSYVQILQEFIKSPSGLPHFKSINPQKHTKRRVPEQRNWIFRSRRGTQLSHDQAKNIFEAAMADLGFTNFGFTPHSMRHTAITNSLFSGVDLETASQMYGNSPATIERVYSHTEARKLSSGFAKSF